MSTRSMIAIPVEGGDAAIGRYHHSDGYPTSLGLALVAARKAHPGYRELIETLIFDHHSGWSTIVNHDWSTGLPVCYCHNDEPNPLSHTLICETEHTSDWCSGLYCIPDDVVWVYRLYPEGVEVWGSRVIPDGHSLRHKRLGKVRWEQANAAAIFHNIEFDKPTEPLTLRDLMGGGK